MSDPDLETITLFSAGYDPQTSDDGLRGLGEVKDIKDPDAYPLWRAAHILTHPEVKVITAADIEVHLDVEVDGVAQSGDEITVRPNGMAILRLHLRRAGSKSRLKVDGLAVEGHAHWTTHSGGRLADATWTRLEHDGDEVGRPIKRGAAPEVGLEIAAGINDPWAEVVVAVQMKARSDDDTHYAFRVRIDLALEGQGSLLGREVFLRAGAGYGFMPPVLQPADMVDATIDPDHAIEKILGDNWTGVYGTPSVIVQTGLEVTSNLLGKSIPGVSRVLSVLGPVGIVWDTYSYLKAWSQAMGEDIEVPIAWGITLAWTDFGYFELSPTAGEWSNLDAWMQRFEWVHGKHRAGNEYAKRLVGMTPRPDAREDYKRLARWEWYGYFAGIVLIRHKLEKEGPPKAADLKRVEEKLAEEDDLDALRTRTVPQTVVDELWGDVFSNMGLSDYELAVYGDQPPKFAPTRDADIKNNRDALEYASFTAHGRSDTLFRWGWRFKEEKDLEFPPPLD